MGQPLFKADVKVSANVLERAKRLLRGAADRVHQHRATVGIHEDEGSIAKRDYFGKAVDASLAEVAMIHEMDGRSFLRTWFDTNIDRLKQEMTEAMRAEYSGDTDAVKRLSAQWSAELVRWIEAQEGHLAPLTERTIEQKQKAGLPHPEVPLLATGQLIESIKARLDGAVAS